MRRRPPSPISAPHLGRRQTVKKKDRHSEVGSPVAAAAAATSGRRRRQAPQGGDAPAADLPVSTDVAPAAREGELQVPRPQRIRDVVGLLLPRGGGGHPTHPHRAGVSCCVLGIS